MTFPTAALELTELVSDLAQRFGDRTIRQCMEILEDADHGRYAFTSVGEPVRASEADGWIVADHAALVHVLLDKRFLTVAWNDELRVPEAARERLGGVVYPATLTDRGREALATIIVV